MIEVDVIYENCTLDDGIFYAMRIENGTTTAFSVMTELKGK